MMNNWYLDKQMLAEAVDMIKEYSCCYPYGVFMKEKTPCCNYKKDLDVPVGLTEAIEDYLDDLSASKYKELANHIAFELGEGFRIRRTAIVKLLTRILADGFPDKELLKKALHLQIAHRRQLLRTL